MLNAKEAREQSTVNKDADFEREKQMVERAIELSIERKEFEARFYNKNLTDDMTYITRDYRLRNKNFQGGMNEYDTSNFLVGGI